MIYLQEFIWHWQKALPWQPNWGIRKSHWTNMTWPAGLSTNWAFLWRGPIHTRPSAVSVRQAFEVLPCGHVCNTRAWSGLRWCGRWRRRWRWPGASPPHPYCTTLVPIVLPLLPRACYCRKRQPYCNKKIMATDCKVRVRKLFCLPIREKLS